MRLNIENKTASELRKMADESRQQAIDSFDRCDTDGFLTQATDNLFAQLYNTQADIVEHGGWFEFPALYDLQGNRVRAKLDRRPVYNAPWIKQDVWAFYDMNDRPTHKYITAFPARESTMAKKGYREGKELADAQAYIGGSGKGLSGIAVVCVKRLDQGYPVDAIA